MFSFQKLIYSESAIYDVLQEFFFHNNALVRVAALEVNLKLLYVQWRISVQLQIFLKCNIVVNNLY